MSPRHNQGTSLELIKHRDALLEGELLKVRMRNSDDQRTSRDRPPSEERSSGAGLNGPPQRNPGFVAVSAAKLVADHGNFRRRQDSLIGYQRIHGVLDCF